MRYRGDLHILVEAPDGTLASSTIMWLHEVNCAGALGRAAERGLYYGVGFRKLSRDAPLIKAETAGGRPASG